MEFGFALLHLSETSEQGPWDFSWVSCLWGFRLLVWRMAGEMSGFHCMYGYLGDIELGRVISRILCREQLCMRGRDSKGMAHHSGAGIQPNA
jgi:hypothetical protein